MDMQERIGAYWAKRADEFGDARYQDLHSQKREKWMALLSAHLPECRPVRALDLGTGAGFFAFLLRDLGCSVTGIDYTQAMIDNAKRNAERLACHDITFLQMDAQNLSFAAESFDFIFTRNVTWTLPDPEKAYREMCRVLAPGGRLMNIDANYGAAFRQYDEAGLTEQQASQAPSPYEHPARSLEMLRERNEIAKQLSVCGKNRPFWDVDVLAGLGMERISIDTAIQRHAFGEEPPAPEDKSWTNPAPLFLVLAEKG